MFKMCYNKVSKKIKGYNVEKKKRITKRIIYHNSKFAIEIEETEYLEEIVGIWYYEIGSLTFNVLGWQNLDFIEQNKSLEYLMKKYFITE